MGMVESEANEDSGNVRVWTERLGEFQGRTVTWAMTTMWSNRGGLEGGFKAMEDASGIASVERGERVEATHSGHEMLYQYYEFTYTDGAKRYGIIGCFHCDASQRAFSVVTMSSAISAKEDILEDFMDHLSSLVCH
jgi:hypothetical protein